MPLYAQIGGCPPSSNLIWEEGDKNSTKAQIFPGRNISRWRVKRRLMRTSLSLSPSLFYLSIYFDGFVWFVTPGNLYKTRAVNKWMKGEEVMVWM